MKKYQVLKECNIDAKHYLANEFIDIEGQSKEIKVLLFNEYIKAITPEKHKKAD